MTATDDMSVDSPGSLDSNYVYAGAQTQGPDSRTLQTRNRRRNGSNSNPDTIFVSGM